jgi:16S rRNA (uracil1498-N3)-methyltransferase
MHRFFVPPELIQAETASLPAETARQIAAVLRLPPGELITLLDNHGWEYTLCLEQVSSKAASGRVTGKRACQGEPTVPVHLYQALTSREKFEWILQKGTELGMSAITPVITARSLVRQQDAGKSVRWQRILQEAAEQCGRGRIPLLNPAIPFTQALKTASERGLCLFAWEEADGNGLSQELTGVIRPDVVSIFIGPEGGFTLAEAEAAVNTGAKVVSLGKRILRTETAALASLTLVMQALGEIG